MCDWLKNILFPTNLLGKKRQSIAYDLNGVPMINNKRTLNILWSGDRLVISRTELGPWSGAVSPQTDVYEYSTDEPITIIQYRGKPFSDNAVFFDCTNVTKLEVNGEILI